MFATEAIRTAVYQRLQTDSLLTAHGLTGVFPDGAPTDQSLPYIEIGGDITIPWDSFSPKGYDVTLMINVWDSLRDGDRYYLLVADCYRLLHNKPLTMTSYTNNESVIEWMTVIKDLSLETRNIPLRLRLFVQESSG